MLTPIEHIINNMLAESKSGYSLDDLLFQINNANIKVGKEDVTEALDNLLKKRCVIEKPDEFLPDQVVYHFNRNGENRPSKAAVLAHYAEVAAPQLYLQLDGWVNVEGEFDDLVNPTGERLSMTGGISYELWRGPYAVRISIHEDTARQDAIDLLKDAIEWLEREPGENALKAIMPDGIGGSGIPEPDEAAEIEKLFAPGDIPF